MSVPYSFGRLSSDQSVGAEIPKPETPFRIAILGDFSGRSNRGLIDDSEKLGRRRPRKIDRESLDEAMAKLGPTLRLPVLADGSEIELEFRSLEDFDPDCLVNRVEAFSGCFDQDDKTALMNCILHHPDFRALEACWRGLDWMLKRTSRCEQVEFRVVDLSFDELIADVTSVEDLESTGLYQLFVDLPASRGEMDPWSLFVGNYLFDLSGPHADVLGRISRIARQASAPFLAGVTPTILERAYKMNQETAEAWTALRGLPESSVLGLSIPRFLLRLPYGTNTRSIDSFEYEECDGRHDWNEYLWGNTSYACAVMLVRGFDKEGWAFKPGPVSDLDDIPLHATVDADGDPRQVTAEAWLVRNQIQWLTSLGLSPLLCVKGRDSLQLSRIQSLALVPGGAACSLLGRWGQEGVVKLPRTGMKWPVSVGVSLIAGEASGRLAGELGEAAAVASAPEPKAAGAESSSDDSSLGFDFGESSAVGDEIGSDGSTSGDDFSFDDTSSGDSFDSATDETSSFDFGESGSDDLGLDLDENSSGTTDSSESEAEPEMDPDLAALLEQLESGES
jgi:pilus assembly protein FimV